MPQWDLVGRRSCQSFYRGVSPRDVSYTTANQRERKRNRVGRCADQRRFH